jgi:hypothetical protein
MFLELFLVFFVIEKENKEEAGSVGVFSSLFDDV